MVHFARLTETLMEYWKLRRSLMMMEVATWDGLNTCFHDQNDDDDVNHDEKTGQYHDDKGLSTYYVSRQRGGRGSGKC